VKSKFETYALTVCAVAMVALMVAGGFALFGLADVVAPGVMMTEWNRSMFDSNDDYWRTKGRTARVGEDVPVRPPEAELTARRKADFEAALRSQRRSGEQLMVHSLGFVIPALVVLLGHWRLARRIRTENGN
jgi:hypothetical protein